MTRSAMLPMKETFLLINIKNLFFGGDKSIALRGLIEKKVTAIDFELILFKLLHFTAISSDKCRQAKLEPHIISTVK